MKSSIDKLIHLIYETKMHVIANMKAFTLSFQILYIKERLARLKPLLVMVGAEIQFYLCCHPYQWCKNLVHLHGLIP